MQKNGQSFVMFNFQLFLNSLPQSTFEVLHKLSLFVNLTMALLIATAVFVLTARLSFSPSAHHCVLSLAVASNPLADVGDQPLLPSPFLLSYSRPSPLPFLLLSPPCPLPLSTPSPTPPFPSREPFPLIAARGPGERVSSASGSGQSPDTRRILVHFRLKVSHLLTTIGNGYRIRQL